MPCLKPIRAWRDRVVNPSTGKRGIVFKESDGFPLSEFSVPCRNKCEECIKSRALQWAVRAWCESQYHTRSQFLTLTYSERFVPRSQTGMRTIWPPDFVNFWKRYRTYLDRVNGLKIRNLWCTEYGSHNTKRPHAHAIVWGHNFRDLKFHSYSKGDMERALYTSEVLSHLWPFGNALIAEANFQTAQYVAKYIAKSEGESIRKIYRERGQFEPFIRSAKRPSLGIQWIQDNYREAFAHDFIMIEGGKYPIPPAFNDWFEKNHGEATMKAIKRHRLRMAYKYQREHPEEYHPDRMEHKENYRILMGKDHRRWIE